LVFEVLQDFQDYLVSLLNGFKYAYVGFLLQDMLDHPEDLDYQGSKATKVYRACLEDQG
jgi:hypothetical protein